MPLCPRFPADAANCVAPQGDELQLNLRVGSEDIRSVASVSQPSLHLALATQTQDTAGYCVAELPSAPDAAARLAADDAVPAAAAAAAAGAPDAPLAAGADAPSAAGTDAAQHAAPTAPYESTEHQVLPGSDARGSSSGDGEGEEPPAQSSDSDEEAISGASDAAPHGGSSSSSSSSDSESDHGDDAQVRWKPLTKTARATTRSQAEKRCFMRVTGPATGCGGGGRRQSPGRDTCSPPGHSHGRCPLYSLHMWPYSSVCICAEFCTVPL